MCVLVWPYRCVDIGVVIVVQGIERAPNKCEQLCSSTAFPLKLAFCFVCQQFVSPEWLFTLSARAISRETGVRAHVFSDTSAPFRELPAASLLAPPIGFEVEPGELFLCV